MRSAWTLDAGKPVKEPQADGNGHVENHLPDFDLEVVLVGGGFCHVARSPLLRCQRFLTAEE
jgi:hypothetical protein